MMAVEIPGTPPEEPAVPYDPATDIEKNKQAAADALEASETAAQEAAAEAAAVVQADNDAANKALEALRAGEPLQDEPI